MLSELRVQGFRFQGIVEVSDLDLGARLEEVGSGGFGVKCWGNVQAYISQ